MSEQRGGKAELLSAAIGRDPMFSHDPNGKPIGRDRVCECGRKFRQLLLSERFLSICEKQGRNVMDLMSKQIPGFFVPVHCPACERVDLNRAAYIANARRDTSTFGERDHAAD